jgi:NUMOD3 motif
MRWVKSKDNDGLRDYYVYAYSRPNGVVCYIGKGRGDRWNVHLRGRTNKHLWAIIQKAGGILPKIKLLENLTHREAVDLEIALIRLIGRKVNGGPLVNQTDGGDGTVGYHEPKSPEHRAKIGAAHVGMKRRQETCDLISLRLKGRKRSPEAIKASADGIRGLKRGRPSDATIEKIRLANTGRQASPEVKAAMSRARRGVKKTPAHVAAVTAAITGVPKSAEHIQAMKAAWTPERRERASRAAAEQHRRRREANGSD